MVCILSTSHLDPILLDMEPNNAGHVQMQEISVLFVSDWL